VAPVMSLLLQLALASSEFIAPHGTSLFCTV
jgi:hypothetical protein